MGNHRADKRGQRRAEPVSTARLAPASGGRRKAARTSAFPKNPLTGIPTAPTLAGAAALVLAAAGAVSLGDGDLPDANNMALSSKASVLNGTDAIGATDRTSRTDRVQAISRDSERAARQDAASQELKKVVEAQAKQRNSTLTVLAKSAEKHADEIEKNLWSLPAAGYHLTARFGSGGGLWSHGHTGLDFAAPSGTPITAVANGVITEVGYDGAYGNRTVETLEDGTEIWYCHQSAETVDTGDAVRGGEQIGNIGTTGNTTGPHVHIEVRPGGGDPVDPYQAFVYHGITP